MASKGRKFAGCSVALVTPFRDGDVDYKSLLRAVDWQIEQGTPVVSPAGTTGEAPTLTQLEHERVIATVVEHAAGRARVLAGTGSCSTAQAIRMTRFSAEAGADGALVVAPYYNRPTQDGLYAHYARIADSSPLPLVLYNIPARTGCQLEPETIERLADHERVVAIKEASGSLDLTSETLARTDLTVLSGNDTLTLPMMALGAEGVVSVVANLVPSEMNALVAACREGVLPLARKLHTHLFALSQALMKLAPNPILVKTALALIGQGTGELRLPLVPPGLRVREALSVTLSRHGLRVHEAGAGA
jgi:4-hydroxy-tetrahydrodipicolinate synthase